MTLMSRGNARVIASFRSFLCFIPHQLNAMVAIE
ncbi:hypothetical protein GGR08_000234 [Bartonella fuyuanensis]|uniref:Uncharacterized protein n=1 Tax=Bartonella fuyuanensis TaxID=1460968 RepID=A0A840DWB4_9HYPH|nr:hypothetical protein [Bartonella fuyuanensis]